MHQNRSGFLFTMALMFGMALLGIAAFLAILTLFVGVIVPTIPDVMTEVPTLYDYDEFGHRILEIKEFGMTLDEISFRIDEIKLEIEEIKEQIQSSVKNKRFGEYNDLQNQIETLEEELGSLDFGLFNQPNQRLEMYWFFAWPSMIILLFFIMFAAASYYFEKSFSIFKKGTSVGILKTSIIGMVAIILVPEFWDIYAIHMKQLGMYFLSWNGADPHFTTQRLWCKMGCIVDIDHLLDGDAWSVALANPSNFGQELLTNALLPLVKIIPTASVTISFFVIAKIKVLFIMIVVITLPIWFVCMNIPKLKDTASDMISNMIGASISGIFSALTLAVGLTYIDSTNSPALEEWITVLGIAIFASVWPIILAPKLSIIASQTTGHVQSMLQSTAMFAANASSGMAAGMSNSGAIGNKNMSFGQKAKTLLTSGFSGGAMGGVGSITPMNIPSDVRAGYTNSMNQGLAQSNVNQNMKSFDSINPNLTNPQIHDHLMHSPGNTVNSMNTMHKGEALLNNPQQLENAVNKEVVKLPEPQQEFAKQFVEEKIRGNAGVYAK